MKLCFAQWDFRMSWKYAVWFPRLLGGHESSVALSLPFGRNVCGKRARESGRILAQIGMMSYNDCLKASAIGAGGQAGRGRSADFALWRLCQIPALRTLSIQHWSAWQVTSVGCTVSGHGGRQRCAGRGRVILFTLANRYSYRVLNGVGAVPSARIPPRGFK